MTTDELTTTQPDADAYRIEHDTMGEVRVPRDALYQAQTQRAIENFPISGTPIEPAVVRALGRIKGAAARVNTQLGVVPSEIADKIVAAAAEVTDGRHDGEFPLDVYQTGSGTSSNMNANEVIATIASRDGSRIHPNDHVNASQSSNDVFPTAVHLAATAAIVQELVPALDPPRGVAGAQGGRVRRRRQGRAHAPHGRHAGHPRTGVRRVCGSGPVLGGAARRRSFPGWPSCRSAARRSGPASTRRRGSPRRSSTCSSTRPACRCGRPGTTSRRRAARDGLVEASGALKTVAVSLYKICNDLRWMGSGPRAGLGEILIPDLQPGSSIMPGKVNPVICEATMMACAQVIGNDQAVTFSGTAGNFELNVMMPVMARNVIESIRLLSSVSRLLADRCIDGIEPRVSHMRHLAESSPSIVTPLNRYIGYENAAAVAKKALKEGRTIRDVVIDEGYLDSGHLTEEQLDDALDVMAMTRPPE